MKKTQTHFDEERKKALSKDLSFKQSWDKPVVNLLELFNKEKDVFSISSCSGRICLMGYPTKKIDPKSLKAKYNAKFLLSSHETIKYSKIHDLLIEIQKKNKNGKEEDKISEIWFQQEPVILHIRFSKLGKCCKDILHIFRSELHFKKSGIFEVKEDEGKIIVEILSVELLKTVLMKDEKMLINLEDGKKNRFLEVMVNEANKNLLAGHQKIKNAEAEIEKYFIKRAIDAFKMFFFGEMVMKKIDKFEKMKAKGKKLHSTPIFRKEEEKNKRVNLWMNPVSSEAVEDCLSNIKYHTEEKKDLNETFWFDNFTNKLYLLIILSHYSDSFEKIKEELLEELMKSLGEDRIHPLYKLMILECAKKIQRFKSKGEKELNELIEKCDMIFKTDKIDIYQKFC